MDRFDEHGLTEGLGDRPLTAAEERWHELLSTRYVCEACLTRYFMKYPKCKACGEIGRIRTLTVSLLDLADDDGELRAMIANGQVFGVAGPADSTQAGE